MFIHFVDTSVTVITTCTCTCISNCRLQCASDEQEFPDWVWDVTWLRDDKVRCTKLELDSIDFHGGTCTCYHLASRFITGYNDISPQIEYIFSTCMYLWLWKKLSKIFQFFIEPHHSCESPSPTGGRYEVKIIIRGCRSEANMPIMIPNHLILSYLLFCFRVTSVAGPLPWLWVITGSYATTGNQEQPSYLCTARRSVYCILNTLRPRQNGHHLTITSSSIFSWMKTYHLQLKFHWNTFLKE